MSDLTKLAVVFRAAADGIAAPYLKYFDEQTERLAPEEIEKAFGVSDRQSYVRNIMHKQGMTTGPIGRVSWMSYDGIADLFERLAKVYEVEPAIAQAEVGAEPETLAYLVVARNYRWSTPNEEAARRQCRLVPNARLIELVEKPAPAAPRGD